MTTKKLTRVMQYKREMTKLTLTIEPNENSKWWVDRSYAIQPDMKSHRGIYMTIGKGATYMAQYK